MGRALGAAWRPAAAAAAARLHADQVLVYPTESSYALGVNPRRPQAVAAVLTYKGRSHRQSLALVAASWAQVEQVMMLSAGLRALARLFWPGPLTLVAPARRPEAWPPGVLGPKASLAIRVPRPSWCRALAAAVGGLITATSANRHGAPPWLQLAAARQCPRSWLGLDAGRLRGGAPSTLVADIGGRPAVLRCGALPATAIVAAWARI